MANYENEINSWPVLKNGLHYKWPVSYTHLTLPTNSRV